MSSLPAATSKIPFNGDYGSDPLNFRKLESERNIFLLTIWSTRIAAVAAIALTVFVPLSFPLIGGIYLLHNYLLPHFEKIEASFQADNPTAELANKISGHFRSYFRNGKTDKQLKSVANILLSADPALLQNLWTRGPSFGIPPDLLVLTREIQNNRATILKGEKSERSKQYVENQALFLATMKETG